MTIKDVGMINKEKISIVVPVYNVESCLSKCVESIINQTYTNIEILLVDDGSQDNSGEICDEFLAKDSRIRVFHIANGGVSKARQLGVESSTGEYIVFVDSDDWLPLDAVEILQRNMRDDIDIVIGAYYAERKNKQVRRGFTNGEYKAKEYLSALILFNIGYPWGRIYRKSLFTNECFVDIARGEDWVMNIELATRVRSACVIDEIVYHYVVNSEHSSTKRLKYGFEFCKDLCFRVKSVLQRCNLYESYKTEYANASLRMYGEIIKKGAPVDRKDPDVIEVLSIASKSKLSFRRKLSYYSLKYELVGYIILVLGSIKRRLKK